MSSPLKPRNAYSEPRRTAPGCQHMPGTCRCDIPYWLRAPTKPELKHWAKPKKQ